MRRLVPQEPFHPSMLVRQRVPPSSWPGGLPPSLWRWDADTITRRAFDEMNATQPVRLAHGSGTAARLALSKAGASDYIPSGHGGTSSIASSGQWAKGAGEAVCLVHNQFTEHKTVQQD